MKQQAAAVAPQRRTEMLAVRVSRTELDHLRNEAERLGVSQAELVRSGTLNEVRRRGGQPAEGARRVAGRV